MPAAKPTNTSPVDAFFKTLHERTEDPVHQRLLKAARRPDPSAALERELRRIMEELINET